MSSLINGRVNVLENILNLETISDNKNRSAIDVLFIELLTKYDKICNSDSIKEYVEVWIAKYFDISYETDNFIMSDFNNWRVLFDSLKLMDNVHIKNNIEDILISHFILSLCEISVINLQKLAASTELRIILQKCILDSKFVGDSVDSVPIQIKNLIKLYSMLLSVTCCTKDIMDIVYLLPSNLTFMIFDNICDHFNNLSLANQIIFENYYHHMKFEIEVELQKKDMTIQLWVKLNDTTHQRILTLGTDLIIEIHHGNLCLCNQEFILGLFDNFEFESHLLYQISLSYTSRTGKWILYVNDELKQCFTIYCNERPKITYVEIGSFICSFKLYSLNIWSLEMSIDMVKVMYKLGPTYKPQISSNDYYWGLLRNFPEGYLEALYYMTESTCLVFKEFQQHLKNLTLQNLALHYDLEDTIQKFRKDSCQFQLNFNYGNESSSNKCYFLYTENIQSKLVAINIFNIIIYQMQSATSPDIIFQYTSLIFNLCNDPTLLLFFQKSVGFDLLAHILYQVYVKNYQKGLSFEFLNLFLQFCGWNTENTKISMLKNSNAYKHLIINFDLWIYPHMVQNNKKIELVRYIFFHLSMLQEINKYCEYNSIELKKIDVFTTICCYLYGNKNEIFKKLTDSIISTLYILIIKDSSQVNYNLIWQIIVVSLENDKLYNIQLFIDVLNQVLNYMETIKDYKFFNLHSANLLLYLISLMSQKLLRITVLIKLLFQHFSINEQLYKKFLVQDGIKLLFNILTRCHIDCLFDILPIIINFSTNRNICNSLDIENIHDFQFGDFESRLPFVCLSIDIIEWMVNNFSQITSEKNLQKLLDIFVQEIVNTSNDFKNIIINNLNLLPHLLNLLFTLHNMDNSETYQSISRILVNFLSNIIIEVIKIKQNARIQLSNLCGYESYFDDNYLKTYHIENCNYVDLIFVETILPDILIKLLDNESTLISELKQNTVMIKNIFDLLNELKDYFTLITYNTSTLRQVYELLFICGEVVLSMTPTFSHLCSKYYMLLSDFSKDYCRMVLNNDINNWISFDCKEFDSALVKYQSSIYSLNSHKNIHDVTQYLLFTLMYRLCLGETSKMLIPAIRALVMFNYENLEDLIVEPYQNCESLRIYMKQFLSSSDEVILGSVNTITDSILNDCTISFYQKKVNKCANRWLYAKPIIKDNLNEIISERKYRYADFNRLEGEKLNISLFKRVRRKTKIINDIIVKKINSCLIKIQEHEKSQEYKKIQINFEIRHLHDVKNKKKSNNLTISNEENSERMRNKIVPW